jgi:dUTP pyrophosphatase
MNVCVLDKELYERELAAGSFSGKYPGDAGIDLRSSVDIKIHAGSTEKVPLGVAVDIMPGYVGWLTGRSATSLDFGLICHEGKIDSGYRGEIHAFLTAQGGPVRIVRGERICQLVVLAILSPESVDFEGWPIVDSLPESDRGERGLGSTGRN